MGIYPALLLIYPDGTPRHLSHGFAAELTIAFCYNAASNFNVDSILNIYIIIHQERSQMKFNSREVSKIIKTYQAKKSDLLAILTDIQTKYNWLPPDAIQLVSEELCVPMIDVYGVASFYHAFSLTPRGKHIVTVCSGTACHVRGAQIILGRVQNQLGISPGCTTKDDQFTLETVNCLGACALAPIVVVDGHYHGQSTIRKVDAVLAKYKKKKKLTKKSRKKK